MTQHAPLPGSSGDDRTGMPTVASRAGVRARTMPPALQRARDELFTDADRHGPRRAALAKRVLPAAFVLPLAVLVTTIEPWRRWAIGLGSPDRANLALVLPVLVALVLLAASLAPLARGRIEPLVGCGLVLLATGAWLVQGGELVWAGIPSSIGALLIGVASARAVRRAVWALPLLLAAGVSDTHSVAFGVTDRLLGGTDAAPTMQAAATTSVPVSFVERIDLLVLHVPVANGTWLLGLVDVVALGMLLGLAHLFWLPLGRTVVALVLALAAAIVIGGAVPVLPLLGAAWLLANVGLVWRSTRFSLRRLMYLGG